MLLFGHLGSKRFAITVLGSIILEYAGYLNLCLDSPGENASSYLWKLFGNVSTNKDSLQVYPQILYSHPVLNDVCCVRQVVYPLLNLSLERCVVPEIINMFL